MTDDGQQPLHDAVHCGGAKRQGEGTCTQPAGWGTIHPGFGRCKLHSGATPNGEKAAEAAQAKSVELANRERALDAVRTWSPEQVPNDPGDTLLKVSDICFKNAVLGQAELYALPSPMLTDRAGRSYTHPLVLQVQAWCRMAMDASSKAVGLDLMGRHMRVQERYGDSIAEMAEGMVREFAPGLDPSDPEVRRRVRRVLLSVAGEAA